VPPQEDVDIRNQANLGPDATKVNLVWMVWQDTGGGSVCSSVAICVMLCQGAVDGSQEIGGPSGFRDGVSDTDRIESLGRVFVQIPG
jgi:hypothetical protein